MLLGNTSLLVDFRFTSGFGKSVLSWLVELLLGVISSLDEVLNNVVVDFTFFGLLDVLEPDFRFLFFLSLISISSVAVRMRRFVTSSVLFLVYFQSYFIVNMIGLILSVIY